MTNPDTTSAPGQAFPRHPRLRSFKRKFGQPALGLACHAAFPIALTPDLLYSLWGAFPADTRGQPIGAPWVAVADLLLSSLCDEVGHELFEFDPDVRDELLAELKNSPRFGPRRVAELSAFVSEYVGQQLRSSDPFVRDFAEAQHWAARAATDPAGAAAELARAYSELEGTERDRLLRLEAIVAAIAQPERASELESLLPYARALADWARGDTARAAAVLRSMASATGHIQLGGLVLPLPPALATPSLSSAQTREVTQQVDFSEVAQSDVGGVRPGIDTGELAREPDQQQVSTSQPAPVERADGEHLAQLRQQRELALRWLRALELQQAYTGIDVPPEIVADIRDQKERLARLDAEIQALDPGGATGGPATDAEEIAHLQQLHATKVRRLHVLEEREARAGLDAPPIVLIEIASLRQDVDAIKRRLGELGAEPDRETAAPEAAPAAVAGEEREQLEQLREAHQRRLHMLEAQQAQFGVAVPPHIVMEIEDTRAKLADIDRQLGQTLAEGEPAQSQQNALPELAAGEPDMTPFSLADLGLSEDEIASMNDAGTNEAPPELAAEEPDMTPFSLADLGLSEDEIASMNDAGTNEAPPELAAEEPPYTPFSIDDLGAPEANVPEHDAPVQAITLHVARRGQGYSISLMGAGGILRATLALGEAQLAELAGRARQTLSEVVYTQIDGQYVYMQEETSISSVIHAQSLEALARVGFLLYEQLFYRPGNGDDARALGDRLRELSQRARLLVTIVAEHFFLPWALLYDRATIEPGNIEIDGFWGFRHVIECRVPSAAQAQPAVSGEVVLPPNLLAALGGEAQPEPDSSVIAPRDRLLLAFVGDNTIDRQARRPVVASHRTSLELLPNVSLLDFSTLAGLYNLLGTSAPAELIYFFGHLLNRAPGEPVALSLADGQASLDDLKNRVPPQLLPGRPLVFLNADRSRDIDPARTDGFAPYFLSRGARVVIGSEASLPALFAAEFGQEFVARFVAGEQTAGNLLLSLRQAYADQRHNLLGLCYTLYGHADTRVERPAPQEAIP